MQLVVIISPSGTSLRQLAKCGKCMPNLNVDFHRELPAVSGASYLLPSRKHLMTQ